MKENDMPTNEEVLLMAQAAILAACEKALELGYPDCVAMLGIERAYEDGMKALELMTVLGPEGTEALVKLIDASETAEMMKQADEALREGE